MSGDYTARGVAFTIRQTWEAWCHYCGWHTHHYRESAVVEQMCRHGEDCRHVPLPIDRAWLRELLAKKGP